MKEQEAYKKLARAILRVNIISLIVAALTAVFSTVLHGFIAFWVSIHLISYAIYQNN